MFEGIDAAALLARARARTARDPPARRRRGALRRRRRGRPLPRRARRRAARRAARGVPRADVPDALRVLVARYARTHGPFTTEELRARYGVDAGAVLRELERAGDARPRRAAPGRQRARVVRRGGPAPPAPRLAGRAAQGDRARRRARAWRPSCPPGRASTATPRAGAGIDRLREVLVPLQGLALPAEIWERDVLPRRIGAYSPSWLDSSLRERRARVGRRRRARALRARGPVLPRGRPRDRPARAGASRGADARPPAPSTSSLRARLAQGPCFFTDLLAELDVAGRGAARGALGPRVGGRGDQRRVGAAARAASDPRPRGSAAAAGRRALAAAAGGPLRALDAARSRFGARRSGGAVAGPGSLVAHRVGVSRARRSAERARAAPRARRAAARALRDRHPRAGARRGDQGRLRAAV